MTAEYSDWIKNEKDMERKLWRYYGYKNELIKTWKNLIDAHNFYFPDEEWDESLCDKSENEYDEYFLKFKRKLKVNGQKADCGCFF